MKKREHWPLYLVSAAAIATAVSITAFEILMALAVLAMVVERKPWRAPPIWLPLALFLLGTVLSLAASGHMREGLPQIRKFYIYGMLFLAASAFQNVRQIRRVTVLWALAAMVSALWGLWQYVEKVRFARATRQDFYLYYVDHRITGFTNHWMTFGGQMMIMLLLIAALVLFSAGARSKGVLIAAALVIAFALYENWTRSMWFGTLLGGVYLIWFWKRWTLVLLPVLAAALWLVSPADLRERVKSAFDPHGEVDSNVHKDELRRIGWEMIKAHPWLGVGPEQVSRQIGDYLPPGVELRPEQYYGHLENDYIQYAAERGVPTMLALMAMIGWALVDFIRALRRLPRSAEECWVLHAAIAVTIGMLVGGFYSWNLNNSYVLAMYLTVVGFAYVASH